MTEDYAAKKIGISVEKLRAVEAGDDQLTFNQLKDAATAYKRPLAIFFLPEPPPAEPKVRDFRLHPDRAGNAVTPDVHVALRRARQRRDEARELAASLGVETPRFELRADPNEKPSDVADRIREALPGVFGLIQAGNNDAALKARKRSVETLGLLVFETSRVPTEAMRGASEWFDEHPVIILNGADSPAARSFTLVHELTHRSCGREAFAISNRVRKSPQKLASRDFVTRWPLLY